MTYGVDFFCVDEDGNRAQDRRFPSLLPFLYADGDGGWLLQKDFTVDVKVAGVWRRMTAKAGFDYDGASIPRLCWTMIGHPMAHDILVAALFHDLLYCVHDARFPKPVCDQLFADVQGCYFATVAKQTWTRRAVALFGNGPWHEDEVTKVEKYTPMLVVGELP